MTKQISKLLLLLIFSIVLFGLAGCENTSSGMLNPKGIIALQERKLLFDTLALMLIVVLPVIIMSFTFIYHYQISHRTRDYKPNWAHSYFLEALWWGIPCAIIVILAVITWKKTHSLDPYRPIPGYNEKPMLIHAIALPWKWIFIYPEQNIATVNYLAIPVGEQIEYWITADNVPMSAFFIPQLGSQIYAMAGMRTRLHLVASHPGIYVGLNSQYNGQGFSDMKFPVYVLEPDKMKAWVAQVQQSGAPLTDAAYKELLSPTINAKPQFFSGVEPDLFQHAIDIYMHTYGNTHPRAKLFTPPLTNPHAHEG